MATQLDILRVANFVLALTVLIFYIVDLADWAVGSSGWGIFLTITMVVSMVYAVFMGAVSVVSEPLRKKIFNDKFKATAAILIVFSIINAIPNGKYADDINTLYKIYGSLCTDCLSMLLRFSF